MNYKTARVSVIIPCYNAEKFICQTLQSIINTDYPNLEIIIIDDGSTDNSIKVIKNFIKKNPDIDIKLYYHSGMKNKGVANTRNLGIEKSSGKYICFLDADDVYFSNRFETAIPLMEKNSQIEAVCEPFVYMYGDGRRSSKIKEMITDEEDLKDLIKVKENNDIFIELLRGTLNTHISSITIRKSTVQAVGNFFDIRYAEDRAFLLNVLSRGKTRKESTNPVSGYLLHDASICSRNEGGIEYAFAPILAMLRSYLWMKTHIENTEYISQIQTRIINKYCHFCTKIHTMHNVGFMDYIRATSKVVILMPSIAFRIRFWKVFLKTIAVNIGISKPWNQ